MKTFLLTAIAFVALPALSGLLPELNLTTARLDLHLPLIVFLAMTGTGVEGAFGAFAIGYLADVHSGHPMGLFLSASMFIYVLARLFAPVVEPRSRWSFAVLALLFDLAYGFFTLALATMSPLTASGSVSSVFLTAPLTAIAAWLLWPLLALIERRKKRRERGTLTLR